MSVMFSQLGQRDLILEKISDCLANQPAFRRMDSQLSVPADDKSTDDGENVIDYTRIVFVVNKNAFLPVSMENWLYLVLSIDEGLR